MRHLADQHHSKIPMTLICTYYVSYAVYNDAVQLMAALENTWFMNSGCQIT